MARADEGRSWIRTTLLSPRLVGGLNRERVIHSLIDHGPLSRSELARVAGVNRGTIGSIVQGLIDDGVLEELAPVDSKGVGKPGRPIWFPADSGEVVAVELTAATVRAALVNAAGQVSMDHDVALSEPSSPAAVLAAVLEAVRPIIRRCHPIGIGLAIPGSCDASTGIVRGSTRVPGAVGRELSAGVASSCALPVMIENDSRSQALAERWFGAGRGVPTFTSVHTGEGLGVGLVLDGRVYRGVDGSAGELGHTTVVFDGEPCICGLRGCWETIASLRWLRREARAAGLRGARTMSCRALASLAAAGDASAAGLFEQYATHLAVGIANLQQLLGPQHVILHGDALGGGEAFLSLVTDAVRRLSRGPVVVVLSELGDTATLLGAAAVVLGERLHTA
jgi:predicted NBD/HSP70 family sugar kinase